MRNVLCQTMLGGLFLMACSSTATSSTPAPPAQCDRTTRVGTYLFTASVASGNCPELPSSLVSLNADDGTAGAGCTVHSDVWSENDCKNERTLTCITNGNKNDTVGVTHQMTADGSRIEGTLTMAITLADGGTCNGTYSATWVRQ